MVFIIDGHVRGHYDKHFALKQNKAGAGLIVRSLVYRECVVLGNVAVVVDTAEVVVVVNTAVVATAEDTAMVVLVEEEDGIESREDAHFEKMLVS